jgi:cyclase
MIRFVLAAFALLAMTVSANGAGGEPPEPQVIRLGERVFALIGLEELPDSRNLGLIGNSTLIVGDTGAVLVDSGFTHEIGLRLRQVAAKITAKPITHVINTHAHGDHFLGNTAFPEAEIISSEKCRQSVATEGPLAVNLIRSLTGQASSLTRPVAAGRVYAEGTTAGVTIDGVRMELWVPPGSHTPGDLLVYLPDDGVLIAGDILANGVVPNFGDSNAQSWLKTVDTAQAMAFTTAIPGHGQVMSKADVAEFSTRMKKLHAEILRGYRGGLSDSEVRATLDLSDWRKLRRFDEMGMAINHIYLEIEARYF